VTRYFITGAQGFVGRYLVRQILEADVHAAILGLGRSAEQNETFTHSIQLGNERIRAPLPSGMDVLADTRYEYIALDLNQPEDVAAALRSFQPDRIIHLASGLRDDPISALLETNVEGTVNLLEALAASEISVRTVVLGSTGGVYGVPRSLPIDENAVCNPIDLYSTTKLAAEHASRILARRYQLPVLWARLFNLIGPGQDERHVCGRFASLATAILSGITEPVFTVETLETTRDFIDVRDVAAALLVLSAQATIGGIYNVAGGKEIAMRTVLSSTLKHAGLEEQVSIVQKTGRVSDIPRHVASVLRLRRLGFECRFSCDESIKDVLNYYSNCSRRLDAGQESKVLVR
jgi:nucleoside-diphosphate-sugar epimerase